MPGLLMLFAVTLTFVFMLASNFARATGLTAREVMEKNEAARQINEVTSTSTLTTGGGGSAEKVKQFVWYRKLTSDGVHFDTLTRFREPAEVRGEGILFLEHDGNQNDVQMYLPAYKKIRRVESQAQSGSFMGSEFSYSDIGTPHLEDYRYELEKSDASCSLDGGKTGQCYLIQSTPANDDVKERTGYSKTRQWIRRDNLMTVQSEAYDADGNLWKKTRSSDLHEVEPSKHKWMAYSLRIDNAKNGKYTVLKFSGVKVDSGIPDSTFTQQNLSRER